MAFSFRFSGDDISSDEDEDELASGLANTSISQPSSHPAKLHDLLDLISNLPSNLTYTTHTISYPTQNQSSLKVPKRAHFDILTQLKAESDPTNTNDTLLAALSTGDLEANAYEGGFKTWECSLDLASYLIKHFNSLPLTPSIPEDQIWHIIELGCGSAIPSLTLLAALLRHRQGQQQGKKWCRVHFTLTDYNEDVLRLSTAPNILLTAVQTQDANQKDASPALVQHQNPDPKQDSEMYADLEDITPNTISAALSRLKQVGITFTFLSGSWSDPSFVSLFPCFSSSRTQTTILASETLYSPTTLPDFTSTLLKLLRMAPPAESKRTAAYLSSKKIYFGVGGGVAEFRRLLTASSKGGESEREGKGLDIHEQDVHDEQGGGVGRVILTVTPRLADTMPS